MNLGNGEDPPSREFDPARLFFPELALWQPLLRRLAIPMETAAVLWSQAKANGTDFQTELLAADLVAGPEFFRAMARELGTGFFDGIDPARLVISDQECLMVLKRDTGVFLLKLDGGAGRTVFVGAPPFNIVSRLLEGKPGARDRLFLSDPQTLREALIARAGPTLDRLVVTRLFERDHTMSAREVASAWQGAACGALAVTLPVAAFTAPVATFSGLHVAASTLFFSCVGLRFGAFVAGRRAARPLEGGPGPSMPFYSVLVALHDEAEIIPQLLGALDRLRWPRSRLEIKLVCEADDEATLAAIAAHWLPSHIEVVRVPPGQPRTKPKALTYALPLARGDLLVLYDAEDIPHPDQLLEAWKRFEAGDGSLACLQAPLEISNREASLVSRMFAFEYAALFRCLLPWLARHRRTLPLGGTSNHFRRDVLEEIGGWDPFNVTEDADLGLRLSRLGYRTGTIDCPTWEAGPQDWKTWLPQRTRWFKGWFQTWLVHMRSPWRLMRELGPVSFLIAQILSAGMVASALAHPFLIVAAVAMIASLLGQDKPTAWQASLLVVDAVNIVCGYLSFLLLGWRSLDMEERKDFGRIVLFTPVYWLMLSLAAWRAVWQLCRQPHLWEKTPHRHPAIGAQLADSVRPG